VDGCGVRVGVQLADVLQGQHYALVVVLQLAAVVVVGLTVGRVGGTGVSVLGFLGGAEVLGPVAGNIMLYARFAFYLPAYIVVIVFVISASFSMPEHPD